MRDSILILFKKGKRFPCRFAVCTKLAIRTRLRGRIGTETFLGLPERFLNPRIAPRIRYKHNSKLEAAIERLAIFLAIGIHKVSSVGNAKTVFPEKPLVYFHLPLIRNLPLGINIYFGVLAR